MSNVLELQKLVVKGETGPNGVADWSTVSQGCNNTKIA